MKNDLPCSRLELQHRMRPRIADLIRPHIYKTLRDHESVSRYEDVNGVQSNVFFLSHDQLENKIMDSTSKVSFVFCLYFKSNVLYIFKIKNSFSKSFKNLLKYIVIKAFYVVLKFMYGIFFISMSNNI